VTDVEVATHLVEGPANAFVAKSDVAARLGELFGSVLAERDMRVQP
jgi:hypothetical protein